MAITPVTVTFGTSPAPVVNPDGSLAGGAMTFQLMLSGVPVTITDSSSGETVEPTPVVAQVYQGQLLVQGAGGSGYQPLVLLANDDPTTTPTGTYYLVTEALVAGSLAPWQFTVHHAASGGTQSIVSQRPVP